jgi:hypothetical protein
MLDAVRVESDCPVDWELLPGDTMRRFCSQCGKYVHNLSAMTASQAEALACNGGEMCVRLIRDDRAGRVVTLDYAPAPAKTSPPWAIWVSAVCAGVFVIGLMESPFFTVRMGGIRAVSPAGTPMPPNASATRPATTAQINRSAIPACLNGSCLQRRPKT